MAVNSVDSTKTQPYLRLYPRFFPKDAEGNATAPDFIEDHPCVLPGVTLPTEGFVANKTKPAPTDLPSATQALMRQGEVLKQQIGPGRHALQYIAVGAGALGLTVACSGQPWAGFAVAAIGLLVGFGVQAYIRQRALRKVGPNGLSGEDFKSSFEDMLRAKGGVLNDPALETSRKMYDFLTRNMWQDCKHDVFAPVGRAVKGSFSLVKAGLGKVFSSQPASEPEEAAPFMSKAL